MDRDTLAGTGQLRFALTPRTTFVASAEALEDRFFSQPLGGPRERESYRYLAGFELNPARAVLGDALAGLRDFPGTLAQGSPPYRGPDPQRGLDAPAAAARAAARDRRA